MRKLLPAVLGSLAFISYGALALDPVKPEIGAGPHLDRSGQTSGPGKAAKGEPGAGASTGPSKPDTVQQEDERKATQSKEKMKKKPGYQEEAPSPRASHTGLMVN